MASPRGTVFKSGLLTSTKAKENSFQLLIKLIMTTVAIHGRDIGNIIDQKIPIAPHPSIMADSSISLEKLFMKLTNMKIVRGRPKAIYGTIKDR
ncbi:hypothetical protein D3C77_605950 [compost metagenome]